LYRLYLARSLPFLQLLHSPLPASCQEGLCAPALAHPEREPSGMRQPVLLTAARTFFFRSKIRISPY
jgi:hypothetical protein